MKVLHLFSGGRDSFLAACKLLEENNEVYIITYDNGCITNLGNVETSIKRLKNKYTDDKLIFLGTKNIAGIWREFLPLFYNEPIQNLQEKYGSITCSEFNCLTCRLSMYIYSIALCKFFKINNISDGIVLDQSFAIQSNRMFSRFEDLFYHYNMNYITPVINEKDKWRKKNELLIRGFCSKTLEPQCIIGIPQNDRYNRHDIEDSICKYYDDELVDKIDLIINSLESSIKYDFKSIKID